MGRRMLMGKGRHPASAGADPFTLDSNANAVRTANTGGGTSVSITGFSTDHSNCRVYVAMACNGGNPTTPTASGVTFTLRAKNLNGATTVALYEGLAASPLSNVTITAGQSSSDFMTATAFAFSGGKASSPYDANASIPTAGPGGTSVSTNNAIDIIVAAGVIPSAIDSPFSAISAASTANFLSCGYYITSATQSSLSPTYGGGSGANTSLDAIVKGP